MAIKGEGHYRQRGVGSLGVAVGVVVVALGCHGDRRRRHHGDRRRRSRRGGWDGRVADERVAGEGGEELVGRGHAPRRRRSSPAFSQRRVRVTQS